MGRISSVNDSTWQLVDKTKSHGNLTSIISTSFVSAKGSTSVNNKILKHQQEAMITGAEPPAKKAKISEASSMFSSPLGLIWDKENYSCGYDSLLVILFDIWKDNPQV